jgi:low affinity Fe/Cu permease
LNLDIGIDEKYVKTGKLPDDHLNPDVSADNAPAPASGQSGFGKFAACSSQYLGSRWAFMIAIAVIVLWGLTGPSFHYSDTWQLIINTGTTIVTFLMVFLIQNTQNHDAKAIHLKLNELIRALDKAKNQMIDVESLSEAEIDALSKKYEAIRIKAQDRERQRSTIST